MYIYVLFLWQVVKINQIIIYLSDYALAQGYYKEIIIQTRIEETGAYNDCHHMRAIKKTGNTHYIKIEILCDVPAEARFVRVVGLTGGKPFYLKEVEVYKL